MKLLVIDKLWCNLEISQASLTSRRTLWSHSDTPSKIYKFVSAFLSDKLWLLIPEFDSVSNDCCSKIAVIRQDWFNSESLSVSTNKDLLVDINNPSIFSSWGKTWFSKYLRMQRSRKVLVISSMTLIPVIQEVYHPVGFQSEWMTSKMKESGSLLRFHGHQDHYEFPKSHN